MTATPASQPSKPATSPALEIAIPVATPAGAEEAASRIERELKSIEGVEGAAADLVRHEVLARLRPGDAAAETAIRARIDAFGWTATEAAKGSAQKRAARSASLRAAVATLAATAVTIAGALTAPGSLSPFLQLAPGLEGSIRRSIPLGAAAALWTVVAISAAAILWCGRDLFARAFRDVTRGSVTRRLLSAAGVGTLFLGAVAGAAMTILGRPGPPLLFGAALWSLAVVLATDALTLARATRRRARESLLEAALLERIVSSPWH
ncbi:MAG TPA: hypothetical protein VFV54_01005, partial [Thermoanaerobaculia bacterium]|nr:hypothetical protein [Thermoanaerobaculia bacterium]